MNAGDFNDRIRELTVNLKPKDRKVLEVSLGEGSGGTAVYIRPVGTIWELVIPVGDCVVYAGEGRRIEMGASHREDGMLRLAIGDMAGHDFRIRGFIDFPVDAEIDVREVEA